MSEFDEALARVARNGNGEVAPARQRVVSVNVAVAYEEVPEGGKALVFRLDSPYIRYDFPITPEIAEQLGQKLIAPGVIVPGEINEVLKG